MTRWTKTEYRPRVQTLGHHGCNRRLRCSRCECKSLRSDVSIRAFILQNIWFVSGIVLVEDFVYGIPSTFETIEQHPDKGTDTSVLAHPQLRVYAGGSQNRHAT